jgi:hypothetical protein
MATTRQVELRDRPFVQPASCGMNITAYTFPTGALPNRNFPSLFQTRLEN